MNFRSSDGQFRIDYSNHFYQMSSEVMPDSLNVAISCRRPSAPNSISNVSDQIKIFHSLIINLRSEWFFSAVFENLLYGFNRLPLTKPNIALYFFLSVKVKNSIFCS